MIKSKPLRSAYDSNEAWEAALDNWLAERIEEDLEEQMQADEDTYDRYGNVSEGGMYDAGGHLITERWADYIDHISDGDR